MTEPFDSAQGKARWILAGLVCAILPIFLYGGALKAPFFFDDQATVVENPFIRNLAFAKREIWDPATYSARFYPYRPVFYLSLMADFHFWGMDPFGYRLTGLLIHIFNSLAVLFLTTALLRTLRPDFSIWIPLGAASAFAVHPLQTEAVTYIANRTDALATLFYFLTMIFFLKTEEAGTRRKRALWNGAALLSFCAGLLTKEIALTLPAALLIYDFFFLSGREPARLWERKGRHWPFWAILAGWIGLRATIFVFYHLHSGALDWEKISSRIWTPWTYALVQPGVILKYIRMSFLPTGLCVDRFLKPMRFQDPQVWIPIAVLPVLWTALWKAGKRLGDSSSIFYFGALWFFLTLLPSSSVFPVNDAMADRRVYLPLWGVLLCLAAAGARWRSSGRKLPAAWVAVLWIAGLSWACRRRNLQYLDPVGLWREAIQIYPDNFRAHNNLGRLLMDRKLYPEAMEHFKISMSLSPEYPPPYYNFGGIFMEQGDWERAEKFYLKAAELQPSDDMTYCNLGAVYFYKKDLGRAELSFNKAIAVNPYRYQAYSNLGLVRVEQGRLAEAEACYRRALEIVPGYSTSLANLGIVLEKMGRTGEAVGSFTRAVQSEPANLVARIHLARLALAAEDPVSARAQYEAILRYSPGDSLVLEEMRKIGQ